MGKSQISINFQEFDTDNELSDEYCSLLKSAESTANSAYAPYSNFKVGAALLLENGIIVKGNNQENSAYPSGLCAERVAMFAASANHPGVPFRAMAVYVKAPFSLEKIISPCGGCRQVMAEYEGLHKKPFTILLKSETGNVIQISSASDLLPFVFYEDKLKVNQ